MGVGHFVPQPEGVDGEPAFGLAALVDGVFIDLEESIWKLEV